MRLLNILSATLAGMLLLVGAVQANVYHGDEMDVELVSESANVVPGQTLWVAVRLDPTEGWHTYSKWPGDSGDATFIHDWQLPEGASVGEIHWPVPEWLPFPGTDLVTFSYKEEVFLPIPIDVPADFSGDSFHVATHVEWQVCDLICLIGDAWVELELPVAGDTLEPHPQWTEAFARTRANWPVEDHDLDALFAVAGDRVSFSFADSRSANGAAFTDVVDAWFFPEQRRILRPGPLRDVTVTPANVQITHNQPRRMLEDLEQVNGLLKVEYRDGSVRGYDINAVPATEETLAAIAAAAAQQPGAGGTGPASVFGGAGQNILLIILFALAGGLMLNLMPCVFPVLSLKALNLASKSQAAPAERRMHGLAYTAGIVLAFLVLASMLLALRAGGEAVGWAFQLQSPWFVAMLVYLFVVMGLSLSGVYEFGTRFMGIGGTLAEGNGYKGSFFTGVLATVVASPCTAPFMGAALGFALSQSWLVAMVVFMFLGVGMAIPFLLLAFIPRLLRFMPKPGPWMVTFKEFMAFPLYATALWLLWVLGLQVGMDGMVVVAASSLLLAFALWLLQKRKTARGGFWPRANAVAAVVIVFGAVSVLALPIMEPRSAATSGILAERDEYLTEFEPFSSTRVDELRASGTPVLVNMTAAWCITCLANENTTLNTRRVQQAMVDHGITYMKGDWTNQDPEISRVLDEFNRPSVPLYILYPGNPAAEPIILPQILTPGIVVDAFAKI